MHSIRSALFALAAVAALTSAATTSSTAATITPFSPQQTAEWVSRVEAWESNYVKDNSVLLEEIATASGVNSAALSRLIASDQISTTGGLAHLATLTGNLPLNTAGFSDFPSSLRPAVSSLNEAFEQAQVSAAKAVASPNAAPTGGVGRVQAAAAALGAVGAAVALL